MTLATTFIIVDPHPPEPLFRFERALLGAEEAKWRHRTAPGPLWDGGTIYPAEMSDVIELGYPSMLDIYYATDGPLMETGYREDAGFAEFDVPGSEHCLRVHWDTAYGYRGPENQSCSDLHAWLILETGLWCERRNLRYRWDNEYSGEWYHSIMDVHELGEPRQGRLRATPDEAALAPLIPAEPIENPITRQ